MIKEPSTFKTQREYYWYKIGYLEAIKNIVDRESITIDGMKVEYYDHLPEG